VIYGAVNRLITTCVVLKYNLFDIFAYGTLTTFYFFLWAFAVAVEKVFSWQFDNAQDRSLCIIVILMVFQIVIKQLSFHFPNLALVLSIFYPLSLLMFAELAAIGQVIRALHGITTAIPVAGAHVIAPVIRGGKGSVARNTGVTKTAISTKITETKKRVEAVKTDIFKIPIYLNEIVHVANHIRWSNWFHHITGVPSSESLHLTPIYVAPVKSGFLHSFLNYFSYGRTLIL